MSTQDEPTVFEKERDRLISEISRSLEEALSSSNAFNRKIEEVLGVGKEFETIASLWGRFHQLMKDQSENNQSEDGMPGTGGTRYARKSTVPDK